MRPNYGLVALMTVAMASSACSYIVSAKPVPKGQAVAQEVDCDECTPSYERASTKPPGPPECHVPQNAMYADLATFGLSVAALVAIELHEPERPSTDIVPILRYPVGLLGLLYGDAAWTGRGKLKKCRRALESMKKPAFIGDEAQAPL